MQKELPAAAAKQAYTWVAGVARCGMGRVEEVYPYVGIRIADRGRTYGGSLIS